MCEVFFSKVIQMFYFRDKVNELSDDGLGYTIESM